MPSLLSVMTRRPAPPTNLGREDRVVLFPSLGHLSRDGQHWVVGVHGDVYAGGKVGLTKRMLLKLLQRAMRAPDAAMRSELFQDRIARFVARDRPGCRVAVRIGEQVHVLPKKTRRNGHFQAAVRIPIGRLDEEGTAQIELQVCGCDDRRSLAAGQVHLLADTGLSVISDIDDTLKHSYVGCKRTLLANTFLRPFETIPGMAPLFREWAEQGAAFHYVSSSPWQLYRHLAEHLDQEGFPTGSFHLRAFRLRDHLIRSILMLRRSGKASVIRSIFRTFPRRRFVLVGDSGEADPEIYGAMARKYPLQVAGIYIRQLGGPKDAPARYAKAFRCLPESGFRLYREAQELAEVRLS
jgi:phosphatidate phosphatase APP1